MEPAEYAAMAAAEGSHWWYRLTHGEVRYWLRRTPPPATPARWLDLGCGTGGLLRELAGRPGAPALIGADYSRLALAHCPHPPAAAVLQASAAALPFRPASFAVVVCLDVLCCRAAYPAFDDTLRQVREALTPGGVFLLQLPAFPCLFSQHDRHVHTVHRFRRSEVAARLHAAGFEVVRVYYRLPALFFLAWLWRRVLRPHQQASYVAVPAPWLNHLLYGLFAAEGWLARGARAPLGSSVFAVARRAS